MKATGVTGKEAALSLAWILITFFILAWVRHADAEVDRSYRQALGIETDANAIKERAEELRTKSLAAQTLDELSALKHQAVTELIRHHSVVQAQNARESMTRRLWMFWAVASFAPLIALWRASGRGHTNHPLPATVASPT
ncbi:MAG: hypothetical protein AB1705_07245 [Verrucomicrobiota bacterium]